MGAEGVTVDKLENAGPALEHAVNAQMNDGKTADRNYKSPIEITPIADASARGGRKSQRSCRDTSLEGESLHRERFKKGEASYMTGAIVPVDAGYTAR